MNYINRQIFSFFLILVFLGSCTSSIQVIKPKGDSVRITLENGSQIRGELLSILEKSVIFEYENHIYKILLTEIQKIYIEGYTLHQNKALLMGFLSIVDLYILYSNSHTSIKVISGLLAIGKLTCILGGDPEVIFKTPIYWRDLDKLRLHCRFSKGLNPQQWEQLLREYGQGDFLSVLRAR